MNDRRNPKPTSCVDGSATFDCATASIICVHASTPASCHGIKEKAKFQALVVGSGLHKAMACFLEYGLICIGDSQVNVETQPFIFSPGPFGTFNGGTFPLVQASCRLPDRPRTPAPCSSIAKNTSTSSGRGCRLAFWNRQKKEASAFGVEALLYQWVDILP